MPNRSPSKKYSLGFVLSVFTFVTIFGSVAMVKPAQAQFGVSILGDLPRMANDLAVKIKEGLGIAVMNAVQKAVSYLMRKLAYDSAVWLASGGKGQSPFAHTSSFGSYMENVAGDAFGEAIAELGKPFGLDLCKVPDVKIDLAIKIGLRARFEGGPQRETSCNWESFKKGWGADSWTSKYGSKDALQKQFNASLKADPDSDMGIYLKSTQKIDNIVSKKTEEKKLERQEGQGFKGLTSLISGDIKTPPQTQKKEAEANTGSEQQKKSEQQIGSAMGSGSFQILPTTLSTFLNTLASQMLKNFKEKGMLPFGVCIGEYGGEHCKNIGYDDVAIFEGQGVRIGGRAAAQAAFSEFLVASIRTQDSYNILAQLENCPDAPGLYNCRIDGALASAVQEANYGEPVTIAEALEKKWLHGDWKLLGPDRPENIITPGNNQYCKDSAYCYANIKVLRQVRILPLGFEIAALKSDPDNPWTLQQVVEGFNKCNPNGSYDPVNYPFCKLIDPNWVLKVEPTRCNALVNSNQPLLSSGPERLEDCADLSSCVAYNKDGTCLSYAYCAKEKNFWRFEADKCDAFYNTCKTFTDSTGNSVSYLYRTLDTSYCDQGSAGCLPFSLNQDASGNWLPPAQNNNVSSSNNGIHFNNKISTSCGSNSFGCSAFKAASANDVLFLRKAPDYLKCYDADPTTPSIDWPKNNADLAKIQPKSDCSLYSKVCTELEVGCNLFTSLLTGEDIPGKFKPAEVVSGSLVWNDQCDERCNGYDAYREMPNNYSNGRAVSYIIPSSGTTCRAEEEGCSSFTNMGEVFEGGEKIEHFSYLRPCIKPDNNKQKNFYTYEGNKDGGYQLKSYTLEKNADGSPKYWYRTAAELSQYSVKCNEANYKSGLSDPDCRQFNDESGNVYYALLEKTIVVNDKCAYYRLNSPELASSNPATCFQNGEYRDGFCFYYGLPGNVMTTAGASRSCSANVESCFAYKGNSANNTKQIFKDDFENSNQNLSAIGWSANNGQLIISTEATQMGGHSLNYSGSGELTKNIGEMVVGRSYVLTFWAKGSRNGVGINLISGTSNNTVGSFNTSDVWQYYSFNPVELAGTTSTIQLKFVGGSATGGASELFIDNIRLVELEKYLYLVRNSLKVDPVCDSNLNDNLPGEALGCSAYTAPGIQNPFYLTNFSYLCRNEAVGCSALIDTQNTLNNEGPEAYNVWLASGTAGTKTITISGQTFSCVVPTGETGCYTNISGFTKSQITTAGGSFRTSTIYIPADTPSSSPVYLVANREASCNQVDLGCTFAGAQTFTATGSVFATVTIKNDPALYKDNLCQSQAVGCNAYSLSGGNYYFKDPVVLGQKVCEYRNGVMVSGTLSSGWFRKDTTSTPCYPNYIQTGNNFGLWSFGDKAEYKNFVGECPANQSGCTEFVDPVDKKPGEDRGRAYYFLNNGKISSGDCEGQVSQKSGCVLFDQTDKPSKSWDASATYLLSESKNSQKVQPLDAPVKDANVILKVVRDRECGEWLQCKETELIWDEQNGIWKRVCKRIDRCDLAAAPGTTQYDKRNCINFVSSAENQYYGQVLTPEVYQSRDTSWKGMEFSGYSFLNMYQPEELVQHNVAASSSPEADWRLVKRIACGSNATVCSNPSVTSTDNYSCKPDQHNVGCGRNNIGICKNGLCVQTPSGSTNFDDTKNRVDVRCRAYPEKDSPFPFTTQINKSSSFIGAKKCGESLGPTDSSDAFDCECDYTKASYGDGYTIKYYNYQRPNFKANSSPVVASSTAGRVPTNICQGGDKNGEVCSSSEDCNGGTCQKLDRESKMLGWRGYCLEQDFSRNVWSDPSKFSCLSWLPVDTITGYADINNQHFEAGYVPSADSFGQYYCLQAEGNGNSAGIYTRKTRFVQNSGNDYMLRSDYIEKYKFVCYDNPDIEADCSALSLSATCKDKEIVIEAPAQPGVAYPAGTVGNCVNTQNRSINCLGTLASDITLGGTEYDYPGYACEVETDGGSKIYGELLCTNDAGEIGKGDVEKCGIPVGVGTTVVNRDLLIRTNDSTEILCIYTGAFPICASKTKKFPQDFFAADYAKLLIEPQVVDDDKYYIKGDKKSGQSARYFYPAVNTEMDITQADIESVKFTVRQRDAEDPLGNTTIILYPNIYKNDGAPYFVGDTSGHKHEYGKYVAGNFMGRKNLPSFFYSSTGVKEEGEEGGYLFVNSEKTSAVLRYTTEENKSFVFGDLFKENAVRKVNNSEILSDSLWFFSKDKSINQWKLEEVCPGGQDDNENWHGVVMHFGENDKLFKGYWMFYCDESEGGGKVSYEVEFNLREKCRVIADTVVDQTTNSAVGWTNRLWKGVGLPGNFPFAFDNENVPFGSLKITNPMNPYAGIEYLNKELNLSNLPVFLTPPGQLFLFPVCDSANHPPGYKNCFLSNEIGGKGVPPPVFLGKPYSCLGDCSSTVGPVSRKNINDGKNLLSELFVKMRSVFTYNTSTVGNSYYTGYTSAQPLPTDNKTKDKTDASRAPKVIAVGKCDLSGQCAEAGPGMTINGKYDEDVKLYTSPADVTLQFFAYADPDQMPLRDIRVDWREGNPVAPPSLSSYYRNRRGTEDGYCVDKKCQLIGTVSSGFGGTNFVVQNYPDRSCENNTDCKSLPICVAENNGPFDFGRILNRTCDSAYYTLENSYSCEVGGVGWESTDCPDERMRLEHGGCCVFKPRVQVKDNWGWCNASSASVCGGDGCYDGNSGGAGVDDECYSMDRFGSYIEFQKNVLVAPR